MRAFFHRMRPARAVGAGPGAPSPSSASAAAPPADAARGLLPPMVVDAERIGRQILMGVHGQRRAGSGEDFWQYRPAERHEPASRIDWRQSARSDMHWVREREAEGSQQVLFWRDPSPSMNWRSGRNLPTKQDRATLCVLALASAALRAGERAGLMTGPEAGRHFGGLRALERLAQGLALPEQSAASRGDAPIPAFLRPWGQAVLVSDFLFAPEELDTILGALAARPGRVELLGILDPAEESLPWRGRVRFAGLREGRDLTLAAVEDLATAYDTAMQDHLAALRLVAGRHRATLTIHRTDQPPLPALLALYARLAGRHAAS